jgi:steroid delta-isomerase-like uncharacterized protein
VETAERFVAFSGVRKVADGALRAVLPVLKDRFDRYPSELVLVFDVGSGRQVDFDLRGTLEQVLARAAPGPRPGRPKLGVTSREVTLLPRHWDWLEQKATGISGALRRLIDDAIRQRHGNERVRQVQAALARFLTSMAGDRPHYEEATRALFQADAARFEALVARWPKDIRAFALEQMALLRAGNESGAAESPNEKLVRELYNVVWSRGHLDAIPRLVAPEYVVHSDPGDAWDGRTLDHAAYRERVEYSRRAFPDLAFMVQEAVTAGERVAVRWSATGTHRGDLPGFPRTGRRLAFAGQTFYEVKEDRIRGHWQVVDRLGFAEQLRR